MDEHVEAAEPTNRGRPGCGLHAARVEDQVVETAHHHHQRWQAEREQLEVTDATHARTSQCYRQFFETHTSPRKPYASSTAETAPDTPRQNSTNNGLKMKDSSHA